MYLFIHYLVFIVYFYKSLRKSILFIVNLIKLKLWCLDLPFINPTFPSYASGDGTYAIIFVQKELKFIS